MFLVVGIFRVHHRGANFDLALGKLGGRIVSLIVADGRHELGLYADDGQLLCQGELELEFDALGPGVGLVGREQFVAGVRVWGPSDEQLERGLLLVEPVEEGG